MAIGAEWLVGDFEALSSPKLNQAGVDGEPQNTYRPSFTAGETSRTDKITKH